MQIVQMKLSEIRPYENNPRKNDGAVDAVANSIKEFGWQQPIVVDSEGVIIAGHTRYKAAKKLKLKTVPVLVVDLDEIKSREYRIIDNQVAEISKWDYNSLLRELQMVTGLDMGDFGFEIPTADNGARGGA